MALGAMEVIVIGVIVVVILMWGPKKLPELARSLGRARREFEQAKKEVENPSTALTNTLTQGGEGPAPVSADEVLLQTARRLGINTEGKTKEQISEEIVAKAKNPYGR